MDEAKTQPEAFLEELRAARAEMARLQAVEKNLRAAEDKLVQDSSRFQAMRQVSLEITSELDLVTLLRSIVSQAVDLLGGSSGSLILHVPERDLLECVVTIGFHPFEVGAAFKRGQDVPGQVWETGQSKVVSNYPVWEQPDGRLDDPVFCTILDVPMQWNGEFLGVLDIRSDSQREFVPADHDFLEVFAAQAAVALLNAQLVQSLKDSEAKIRTLVETSPDFILQADLQGRILVANRQTAGSLGYESVEEMLQEVSSIQELIAPADRPRLNRDIQQIGDRRILRDIEYQFRGRQGRSLPVEVNMALAVNEDEQPVGFICVGRDILERKKAEEERQRLEARIQRSQKLESLGLMAGGIAHDFNNLLMAIIGNAELAMLDLLPGSSPHTSVQEIIRISQRASELSRQMLVFAGRGSFAVSSLDLNELIERMLPLLRIPSAKRAQLKLELAEELPSIKADASQVQDLLIRTVTNSAEAMGDRQGQIGIRTGRCVLRPEEMDGFILDESLPSGELIRLEITDNGCGMDQATMEKIFDPFFTTKTKSRGLGLPAVLGIVRGHHGAIRVQSETGRGTTVTILFPPAALVEAIAEKPAVATAEVEWKPSGTILVVDDEEPVRWVASKALQKMGFEVITAADGQEGVAMFREQAGKIAAILLDMTMPNMDGTEAFREIRKISRDVPVVLTSGYDPKDALVSMEGENFSGFLQKPFKLAMLQKSMRDVLAKSGN